MKPSSGAFEDPLLRDYMAHQSTARQLPLVGISIGRKLAGMFVQNELVVNQRDQAAIAFLVDRFGGEVIQPEPVPERPRGLESAKRRDVDRMPRMVTVKIKADDAPLDALSKLVERENPDLFRVSSRAGLGTLAVSLMLREKGLGGQLNLAGMTNNDFPDETASEVAGDPYQWPEYAGKSAITRAWALCQSLDNVRSLRTPIIIGILDTGFAPPPSVDFATSMQLNLVNEGAPVFGPSAVSANRWHGSRVTGVACAIVDNIVGAAGVAGLRVGPARVPVAMPFMFRTNMVVSEMYRCLQCCVAWGIDVLNISFGIPWPKILLPIDSEWDSNFQFAKDQGLIVVASAGNEASELPDYVIFPATRTPGVITVGALDGTSNAAHPNSNYGSSVDVWAPGTHIHTVETPGSAPFMEATSAAAPIVAGVAALLKSANPNLRPDDVKALLRDTASTDSPDWKSNRILNAYRAVLKCINFELPPGFLEEPNNSPATAKPMAATPYGYSVQGETVISRASDIDFHRFTTTEYSDIFISMNYVHLLSTVVMEVLPGDTLAFDNLVDERRQGVQMITLKQAPPGDYIVKIRSNAPNYYAMRVRIERKPLMLDLFEDNNTRDNAPQIRLRDRSDFHVLEPRVFYQGDYEATITTPSDVDWYHVTDIDPPVLTYADCKITKSDAPLDITLYGPNGNVLNTFAQVKHADIQLPEPECWIEVRCTKATRYSIFFGYVLNKSLLPAPHQKEHVEVVPDWWPDPPFVLREWEKWLQIVIDPSLQQHGELELRSDKRLQWDLLSPERLVLKSSAGLNGNRNRLNVRDLAPGKYLLRVSRDAHAAARFEANQQAVVKFGVGPAF